MTSHRRSRSKGSFSIFSFDILRSFSGAGSRAASRARHIDEADNLARSPSSLSRCDPLAQLPPSPAGGRAGQASSARGPERTFDPDTKTPSNTALNRGRPLSWILFRTPAQALKQRSMSVQLPKDTSSSTMARSVISAPILTSTTNPKVAEAEGVHCGELTQDAFDKKHEQSTPDEARHLADKISKEQVDTEKPSGRFQRLGGLLRGRLRKTDDSLTEDRSSLNHKIARRRAETLNLCKEKIKDLTGDGLVRRKSIDARPCKQDTEEDPPLLKKTSQVFTLGEDSGSQYGSLSKSFNSALEKLDIAATTNMSFLRSRSSLFNLRKENVPAPVTTTLPPHTVVGERNKSKDTTSTTAPEAVMVVAEQNKDVRQYHYSSSKGGYISASPCPGFPSAVNGLRMHTDTMAFATPPKDQTAASLPRPDQEQPLDNEERYSLDEAPIFSPSMGDLSQYSNSPAAKTPAAIATTPTKAPVLKKSRSGLGLLGRAGIARRDENQSLKKSRSLSFNPFRKETPPPTTTSKDFPYKPATPSPLRHEAKLVKGHTARPGLSPRSTGDQAKRFGVIGVPSPSKPGVD